MPEEIEVKELQAIALGSIHEAYRRLQRRGAENPDLSDEIARIQTVLRQAVMHICEVKS